MPDTHEDDLLRSKMLKLDKIIHTVSNELLMYLVNKSIKEMEIRHYELYG